MKIFEGGTAIDDRGKLSYFNEIDFKDVKRFYVVENHSKGFIRAWHGHRKETKYVYVISGAAIVAYYPMEGEPVFERHVLSADKPKIICIPAGNYNGFKTLTDDTKIIFFSTTTLDESKDDDFRLPATGKIFEVTER